MDWKFNSSTLFFHNIFLEQDLADNVLRENNSWKNILTFGSAIADIYLEIDKSHFFEKGFDFLLELNNFFKEETGIKLIDETKQVNLSYGEEWKRLGNIEFIKRADNNYNEAYIKFSKNKETNEISFLLKPQISCKKYLSISYQLSTFGLIHSYSMVVVERNTAEETKITFPIQLSDYSSLCYQIFEGDDQNSFSLISERKIIFIMSFHFNVSIGLGLPPLVSGNSFWNSFLSEIKKDQKEKILQVSKKNEDRENVVKSDDDSVFHQLQKYHSLINHNIKNRNKFFSKFFQGSALEKLDFAIFLKENLVKNKEGITTQKIIITDPFANEEAIKMLVIHQSIPVELVINSERSREQTEDDPLAERGSSLRTRILKTCEEYLNEIPHDSKIIDINKISNPKERSFHDRYIILENNKNNELFYQGFILSSSLTSYFAGTPATVSEINTNTSSQIYQYLELLISGFSTLKKKEAQKSDLDVKILWPDSHQYLKQNSEKVLIDQNNIILNTGKELLDTNQLMELTLDDKEGKEKFSPSFNQSNPIDFSKLIDHFRKCQTEVLFHFFAFLNILLGHTYNNSQNKFSESLYMTFLCDSYIKEKYYEYINNWGNYIMMNEFICITRSSQAG